jgi:hypothetical protein
MAAFFDGVLVGLAWLNGFLAVANIMMLMQMWNYYSVPRRMGILSAIGLSAMCFFRYSGML